MKTMTIRGFDPELAEKIRRTAEKEKRAMKTQREEIIKYYVPEILKALNIV